MPTQVISVNIDEKYIHELICKKIEDVLNEDLTGIQWSLDEFREKCCGRKSKEWVTLYIFKAFENEIVVRGNEGWLEPSSGRGSANRIWALKAKSWMEENHYRINWQAKLPK